MAERLQRSENDDRAARPPHPSLRHRRDRQRKLAPQEPRLSCPAPTGFRDVTIGSGPMPRKPIGEKAMTDAERQARYRVSRAADAPVIRTRRPALAGRRRPAQRAASAVCRLARSAAGQPTRQRAGRGPPGYLRTQSLRTRERGTPTRLRTRLTSQRRTLKTSQRVAPSGSQTPGLTTGATPARGSPPGAHRYPPRCAPPAPRTPRRYARVPPMHSEDQPLPMIKRGPFSMPIGAALSTPTDTSRTAP